MADRIFVDTNVLLPFYFPELESHEMCKAWLDRQKIDGVELWISGQVIREFYVQANNPRTFKQATVRDRALPLKMEPLLRIVESIPLFFDIVDQPQAVHQKLPQLLREYQVRGIRTHDANILATMLVHGFDKICSLDSDFEDFSNRITILRPQVEDTRKGAAPA